MTASMGRATARARLDKPEALNAPLFRLLVDRLETAGRHVVLDLGATSTPMLTLLGRSRCRVEIADLVCDGGIDRLNVEAPAAALVARAESLLPAHRRDEPLDFVFCWDLPNYLQPASLQALMGAIAARARPGALAHALIVYAERTMPDRPGRFVPTGDSRLANPRSRAAEIQAPRYSPKDLRQIMGGFAIERAMLLANGMQEFMFRLKE